MRTILCALVLSSVMLSSSVFADAKKNSKDVPLARSGSGMTQSVTVDETEKVKATNEMRAQPKLDAMLENTKGKQAKANKRVTLGRSGGSATTSFVEVERE